MYWDWTIRLDGQILSNTLDGVQVTVGAQNPLDQSMPAFATITIQGLPVIGGITRSVEWYLGRSVEIIVTQSGTMAGGRIFYGRVTQQTTTPLDVKSTTIITELNAQSYMDRLQEVDLAASDLPAATEYERVYSLIDRQLSPSWAEQPSTMTWADIPSFYDSDITWAEWEYPDAYYRPLLKVPNWVPGDPDPSIELEAFTGDTTELLTHSIDMAMGCGGWVCEYFGGIAPEIWYLTRSDLLSGAIATVNVATSAQAFSLTDTAGIWDVYNEATVANSTLSASDADFDSMQRFGRMPLNLTSMAALEADLQTIATTKVSALARPIPNLTSITLDYNALASGDRLWHMAAPIRRLTGIPAAFGGSDDYYVRGLVFRGSKDYLAVDWVLLNRRAIEPGPMWRNVNPTLTWADLITTWNDWNS